METKVSVVGLGYVGVPLVLALDGHCQSVVGYDLNKKRIEQLSTGIDATDQGFDQRLRDCNVTFTCNPEDLAGSSVFIVTVPTPIDQDNRPDLRAVVSACELVGSQLSKDSVVVFESTVYPGVTEEVCSPVLERVSGMKSGVDFFLGYSPERVNPGDTNRTLEKIVKVVAGQNEEVLERLANLYGSFIEAGVHKASTIKVAEAAKVIENTQRDLNIALMNELALIFDRLDINTNEVLEAAGTKWNFLPFKPGLVGGHCIGVDPYYLTTKAEQAGYKPQVILAGRRINDNIGKFVATKLVKLLAKNGIVLSSANVAILGLTFKENVSDIRNSRVPDILKELAEYNVSVDCFDPRASVEETREEYGVDIESDFFASSKTYDAIVLAVAHSEYKELPAKHFIERLHPEQGIFLDIKAVFKRSDVPSTVTYWNM